MGKFLFTSTAAHKHFALELGDRHLIGWFLPSLRFGNGRIGRAIAEMCLARSDGSALRCYSMTASH